MRALVVHGPNLNLLGSPQLALYGPQTLEGIDDFIRREAAALDMDVAIHQTAREGEIIELLHAAIGDADGAVLNPAAYAHTSRAIADAVRAVPYPVVEVHLSNIYAGEPWRRTSLTAEAAFGMVAGFGAHSYAAALALLKGVTQ